MEQIWIKDAYEKIIAKERKLGYNIRSRKFACKDLRLRNISNAKRKTLSFAKTRKVFKYFAERQNIWFKAFIIYAVVPPGGETKRSLPAHLRAPAHIATLRKNAIASKHILLAP